MPFGFSLSDSLDQILSEYAIVHPIKTDANGRVLSTSVSTHHHTGQDAPTSRSKGRSKRGTLADSLHETLSDQSRGRSYMDREEGLYYNISVFGHDLHLQLHPNSRLVAPTATVEWWEESGDRHSQPIGDTDCFYTGQVSNMEDTAVAISNCDGMVGAIFASLFHHCLHTCTSSLFGHTTLTIHVLLFLSLYPSSSPHRNSSSRLPLYPCTFPPRHFYFP